MNNSNRDEDENDLYTSIEPEITYCSSSSINCGVSTILSSRQVRPRKKLDMLFTPISSPSCDNSFSFCNTIILSYITNEESMDISPNDNDNKKYISNIILTENDKEKEKQQISFIRDKTTINTLSSRVENKENEENIQQKDNENNNVLFGKNCSYSIKKINKLSQNNYKLYFKEYEEKKKRNENENVDDEDINHKLLKGKSCKVEENLIKNTVMEKGEKRKKIKLKDGTIIFKVNNKNTKKKQNSKKNKTSLEKSKTNIDSKTKRNQKNKIDSTYKIKTSKICHTFLFDKKKDDKGMIAKKNVIKYKRESSSYIEDDDEDENDEENKNIIKKERKISNVNEDNISNINNSNNTSRIKKKIEQYHKLKFNKSFHIRPKLNMLKEHLRNKKKYTYSDEYEQNKDMEKDKSSIEKNSSINKETKGKNKKYQRRINDNDDKEDKDREKGNGIINKDEKRNALTLEEVKALKKFKKKIIEKLKQKEKKDKNKPKDKYKEKSGFTSGPLLKKEFFSSNKNIQLDGEREIERANSHIIKTIERKSSVIFINSNSDEEIKNKKIICKGELNKNMSEKEIKSKKKINKIKIDFDNALENNKKKLQYNLFSKDKFTNTEVRNSDYLKYTLNCMDLILDMDREKQTRLKNKINLNFKKSKKKKIALFDLDETLVHCTGDIKLTKEKYQHVIQVTLPGKQTIQVGINIRPYWKQTLNLIKKKYYIVIYTASHHAYADAVLDFMDPKKKYFKYRLYRNNCSLIDVEGAQFYVKDLDIFTEHYNLKDIIIIDNSVLSFAYHLHNGIPIVPYYDEDKDGSLYVVGLYLMHIFNEEDLREANEKYINLDSFLEEAKKRKEENISDDELFLEEEEESYDNEDNKENKENKDNNEINDENKKIKTENEIIVNKNNRKSIIKNVRNSLRKFSEKKVSFNIRKKLSVSEISDRIQRKRSEYFEEENNKLRNKSKLFKMYDVIKDESPKSDCFFKKNESFDEIGINNEKRIKNICNNNIIIEENNENLEEVDCKSDNICKNNLPDDDDDKEEPVLARGLTLRDDLIREFKNKNNNEKNGKNLKFKLSYIRSNFYNSFKNM